LSRRDATLQACRLRLRPILMTSFAFILGVVPLLVGTGAGSEMRRQLGIAVFSGMLGVTLFGIFLTPVFFNVIEWFIDHGFAGREWPGTAGRVLRLPLHAVRTAFFWPVLQLSRALNRTRTEAKKRPHAPAANGAADRLGREAKRPPMAGPNGDGVEESPSLAEQK
jgi:hypothetical protein